VIRRAEYETRETSKEEETAPVIPSE
jgi:hypothetical protein